MKYLCLIYADESQGAKMTKEQMAAVYAEYGAFTESIQKSGQFIGGNPLQSVSTASTVRVRDGKVSITDGPFAETKEQLGGYYLLDCKNLDEAIQWAAKIPNAKDGTIEVRPIMDFSQAAQA